MAELIRWQGVEFYARIPILRKKTPAARIPFLHPQRRKIEFFNIAGMDGDPLHREGTAPVGQHALPHIALYISARRVVVAEIENGDGFANLGESLGNFVGLRRAHKAASHAHGDAQLTLRYFLNRADDGIFLNPDFHMVRLHRPVVLAIRSLDRFGVPLGIIPNVRLILRTRTVYYQFEWAAAILTGFGHNPTHLLVVGPSVLDVLGTHEAIKQLPDRHGPLDGENAASRFD